MIIHIYLYRLDVMDRKRLLKGGIRLIQSVIISIESCTDTCRQLKEQSQDGRGRKRRFFTKTLKWKEVMDGDFPHSLALDIIFFFLLSLLYSTSLPLHFLTRHTFTQTLTRTLPLAHTLRSYSYATFQAHSRSFTTVHSGNLVCERMGGDVRSKTGGLTRTHAHSNRNG